MDNTQYLKELAAAEKRNKQTELEQAKAAALKANEEEKTKALKTYDTQRKATSVNSQLGAKNFAEFLASRGQTNMGIAAQAEMSRNNALNRDISTINTNEAQTVTDYGNKATDINTGYQNNLLNANNAINQELRTNLYNERLRAEQEAYQRRQDRIANAQRWASINASKDDEDEPVEGTVKSVNGVPYVYANGKWVKQTYSTTGTKLEKWNKQGYGLSNVDTGITYKSANGKTGTYKAWIKDGNYYLIAGTNQAKDTPILLSGDEATVEKSVYNAVKNGNLSKTKATEIMNTLFN